MSVVLKIVLLTATVVAVSIEGLLWSFYSEAENLLLHNFNIGTVILVIICIYRYSLLDILEEDTTRRIRLHDPSTGEYVGVDILVHDDPDWKRFASTDGLDTIKKCLLKRKCSKKRQPSDTLEEWEDGCRHYRPPQPDTIKKRISKCTNGDSPDNAPPEAATEEKDTTGDNVPSLVNGELPDLDTTTQIIEDAFKFYPGLLPPGIDENVKKAVIKFLHKEFIDIYPDLCKLETSEEQMAFAKDRFTSMVKTYNDT